MKNEVEEKNEMSIEEMEQQLAKAKKAREAKRLKERKDYEQKRDELVAELSYKAIVISEQLENFKKSINSHMIDQKEILDKYGLIRTNSKGGFSITNTDGTIKLTRTRSTDPKWDERGDKGVELIKNFLLTTVKKRNVKLFNILMTFLEKNAKHDLEYSKVMKLITHENEFKDENWKEGLRLIKESYNTYFKKFGFEVKLKDESGNWERVELNFSAV